jgi:excisionase family DNA binding protein
MQITLEMPRKATFNTREAADICGVTQRCIYNWINDGKIKGAYRLNGSHYRIPYRCFEQVFRLSSECYLEE